TVDVLHCDLNNFYASVEQVVNPELRQYKYLAVSGNPETRSGIILAKNTAAKAMGVKTGEPIWQARQKCPELKCVLPHFEYYVHYSKRVREIYERFTDKVEGFGLDECWLDVTHSKIFGTPAEIAEKLRQTVKRETGLTISVGVSFTKTFAKLGSDLKKPDAVTVISRENYKDVVWRLPVAEMLYIGKHTEEKLHSMGIFTLGDLANGSLFALKKRFGVVGEKLYAASRGEDEEEVRECGTEREIKSVGHGTTTLRDVNTYEEAEKVIFFLSDMVATRLRRYGLQGDVVALDIRRNDLTHESKQHKVRATHVADDIYQVACRLLRQMWREAPADLPLRSITVRVAALSEVGFGYQTSIFDVADEKDKNLEYSVDQIRKKFGYNAITRASLLDNDLVSDKLFSEEDLLPFKR
ncbi:MAG: DNA polymerase IV, partial [Clostridiales bacterium]|nr:DNA polymerase IV [Clostridiales bacterium]